MPIVVGDFFHIILASTTHFDNFSGLSENDGASPIQIDMDSPGRYFQMLPRVYTTQFHSEDLRFFWGT